MRQRLSDIPLIVRLSHTTPSMPPGKKRTIKEINGVLTKSMKLRSPSCHRVHHQSCRARPEKLVKAPPSKRLKPAQLKELNEVVAPLVAPPPVEQHAPVVPSHLRQHHH
ncbi:hypothetical protein QQ045_019398 [Rhodiola kirilowii]